MFDKISAPFMIRKIIFTALLLILSMHANSQTRIGFMAGYGTGLYQFCSGLNAEYFINEKIAVAPSAMVFFGQTSPRTKEGIVEINFDGHYYFYTYDIFRFYGIGGLSALLSKHHTTEKNVDTSYTKGNLTLNLGGGVNFDFGKKVIPYSEIKIAFDNEVAIVVGLKFNLNN